MKFYIVRMRDTSLDLVGPFRSAEAAAEWGQSRVHNPEDDPRWHVLQLSEADAASPLALLSPY